MRYTLNSDFVELEFTYTPAYSATLYEPGADEEIEITAILYKDVDISPIISDDDYNAMEAFIYEQIKTGYYDD